MTGIAGWRPSMFELWQQAEGDGDRYRELLREWGHVLRPGDEGYEDASSSLPCGWPSPAGHPRGTARTPSPPR